MELFREIIASLFIVIGVFFYLVGVIGLMRMPDVFTRMHTTTKSDTMGAGMMFIGLIIWQGFTFISLNILLVLVFIWLTNPTAAHYMAKSEYFNQGLDKDIK